MPAATPTDELRFSDAARSLAPRARIAARFAAGLGSSEDLRVEFARDALVRAARDRIEATPALHLSAGLRQGASERAVLLGSAGALRELVTGNPDFAAIEPLAILLAAHDGAHRPAAPGRIMGVLNVTPDSFSDGGRFDTFERAVEHGLKLVSDGAEILDVGGESTRPGASAVSAEEEQERVVPVIARLSKETPCPISIDTSKASVARAAIRAGATMVNDVSAGRFDPELLDVVAEHEVDVVLMHMQKAPRNMQDAPTYEDVVGEVTEHLRERVAAGMSAGIPVSRIAVDPGIGFGKRLSDNLELIRSVPELRSLGLPVALGVSRKSFLGRLSGEEVSTDRAAETIAAASIGAMLGVDIHRVHDVAPMRAALLVAEAIRDGRQENEG